MNFYKNYGMEVINNENIQTEHGTIVMGDLFIQIFYPESMQKVRKELAGKQTTIDTIDIKRVQEELIYQKNEIIFLIHNDGQYVVVWLLLWLLANRTLYMSPESFLLGWL